MWVRTRLLFTESFREEDLRSAEGGFGGQGEGCSELEWVCGAAGDVAFG